MRFVFPSVCIFFTIIGESLRRMYETGKQRVSRVEANGANIRIVERGARFAQRRGRKSPIKSVRNRNRRTKSTTRSHDPMCSVLIFEELLCMIVI